MPIKLAIIGAGKIATDEHRPAIAAGNTFELVALVGPGLDTDETATPARLMAYQNAA